MQIDIVTDTFIQNRNAMSNDELGNLDQIFDHLDPQQWLTPSAVDWGHWDLTSLGSQRS